MNTDDLGAGGRAGWPGPATNQANMPVEDPSPNVFDLVRAESRRQDDLREMQANYLEKIAELRAGYTTELRRQESARIDQMRTQEASRIDEMRAQEAARIDAIRAVDKQAVDTATAAAQAAANALAATVATTAEAQRVALGAALEPMQRDIADLRRVQYEQQGQKAQQGETGESARDLLLTQQAHVQATATRTQMIGVIIAALVLLLGFYTFTHTGNSASTTGSVPCTIAKTGELCISVKP